MSPYLSFLMVSPRHQGLKSAERQGKAAAVRKQLRRAARSGPRSLAFRTASLCDTRSRTRKPAALQRMERHWMAGIHGICWRKKSCYLHWLLDSNTIFAPAKGLLQTHRPRLLVASWSWIFSGALLKNSNTKLQRFKGSNWDALNALTCGVRFLISEEACKHYQLYLIDWRN